MVKFILVLSSFLLVSASFSQETEKDSWTKNWWVGTSGSLGYAADNNGSIFVIGLSPYFGYKVAEEISIGPTFLAEYRGWRVNYRGETLKIHEFNKGVGAFGRYLVFAPFFIQAEYLISWYDDIKRDSAGNWVIIDDEIKTEAIAAESFYLGAGYNSGGRFSTELLLLYDFLLPEDSLEFPIDIRIGITYNF